VKRFVAIMRQEMILYCFPACEHEKTQKMHALSQKHGGAGSSAPGGAPAAIPPVIVPRRHYCCCCCVRYTIGGVLSWPLHGGLRMWPGTASGLAAICWPALSCCLLTGTSSGATAGCCTTTS
jgi:hypothetical protein